MQGTAGVFSTVNTKEKDRILTDQDRATENDKLEQMQSTVAVVRGGGGGPWDTRGATTPNTIFGRFSPPLGGLGKPIKIGWQIATLQSSCQVLFEGRKTRGATTPDKIVGRFPRLSGDRIKLSRQGDREQYVSADAKYWWLLEGRKTRGATIPDKTVGTLGRFNPSQSWKSLKLSHTAHTARGEGTALRMPKKTGL